MKRKSVSTLILLSGLVVTSLAGCSPKKTVNVAAYPSPTASGTTSDNLQNYAPYQQGTDANSAYYGNGATVTDDNGEFDQTNTSGNGTTNTSTSSTGTTNTNTSSTGTSTGSGGDFDIPTNLPNLEPYSPAGGAAQGYSLAGGFPVDQDSYVPSSIPLVGNYLPSRNQWQAVGVAVSGSNVIVTAFDQSGLLKKGTVISMSASDGKSWSNVGSEYLGTVHPLNVTVRGVAVDPSGQIYANDSQDFIYQIPKANSIKKVSAGLSGATDIAYVNGSLVVATPSGLKKYDPANPTTPSDYVTGVTPSGGIGADKSGNLFVISTSTIKKVAPDGKVTDFVTGVDGAVDVAPTDDGSVAVLTGTDIKLFDKDGKPVSSFGEGDLQSPSSIAASGKDIFVADKGSSYKDSMVVKYSILSL